MRALIAPVCLSLTAGPLLGVGQYAGVYSPRIVRAGPYGPPSRTTAWTATPRQRIALRAEPAARAKSLGRARLRTPSGNANRLLVMGSGVDQAGVTWVRVLVSGGMEPVTAWAPVGQLRVAETPFRVEIRIASRRLSLLQGGHRLLSSRVGVGGAGTPTPLGTFAVREIVRPGRITARAIGPVVVALTGMTSTPNEFPDEVRRLALIGLGRNSSRLLRGAPTLGSVRTTNRAVVLLGRVIASGVPVTISAR